MQLSQLLCLYCTPVWCGPCTSLGRLPSDPCISHVLNFYLRGHPELRAFLAPTSDTLFDYHYVQVMRRCDKAYDELCSAYEAAVAKKKREEEVAAMATATPPASPLVTPQPGSSPIIKASSADTSEIDAEIKDLEGQMRKREKDLLPMYHQVRIQQYRGLFVRSFFFCWVCDLKDGLDGWLSAGSLYILGECLSGIRLLVLPTKGRAVRCA